MSNFDIGLAMVAARIASSETERDQRAREKPEQDPKKPGRSRKSSLSNANLEVINGELVLIPSVRSPRYSRGKGWTLKREDGSIVRLDTGEILPPPDGELPGPGN